MTTVGPGFLCISGGHCVVLTSTLGKMDETTRLIILLFLFFPLLTVIPMFVCNLDNAVSSFVFLIALDFWQYVTFRQTLEDL